MHAGGKKAMAGPEKYPPLTIFHEVAGKRVWRNEVYAGPHRKLSADERRCGPKCKLDDGIYIVTVSDGTPAERFDIAHLLNLASAGKRTTHANGFVPTNNYDSAIAVINNRVVGGIIADSDRAVHLSVRLQANGIHKCSALSSSKLATRGRGRPVIWDLWVHPAHRRKGVAEQLLVAMAARFGCIPTGLGFRVPISGGAVRLLRSMGIKEVVGCN